MWASPSDVTADDATDANCLFTSAPEISYCLKATNFGFAIPSGATILGVRVIYKAKSSADYLVDEYSIRLVVGGTVTGDDETVSDPWETGYRTFSRGGASTLWGLSLTPDQVNASAFGVALVAVSVSGLPAGYVDYITLEITYEDGGSEPSTITAALPLSSRLPPVRRSTARLFDHYPELVPETPDSVPMIVRGVPRLQPWIVARSRVIGSADDFQEESTPGWEASVIYARGRGPQPLPIRSRVMLLDAPDGQGSVCCCPFGAVVVSRRFATALVVAEGSDPFVQDPSVDPPVDPVLRPTALNTAAVVADKFATAILIENTCTC